MRNRESKYLMPGWQGRGYFPEEAAVHPPYGPSTDEDTCRVGDQRTYANRDFFVCTRLPKTKNDRAIVGMKTNLYGLGDMDFDDNEPRNIFVGQLVKKRSHASSQGWQQGMVKAINGKFATVFWSSMGRTSVVPISCLRRNDLHGMEGLDGAGNATAADLLRQLKIAHDLAPKLRERTLNLFQQKALTNDLYLAYRRWVDSSVKLRQNLTQLMRDQPKLADAIAKQLGTDRNTAILKVENMSLPNFFLGTSKTGLSAPPNNPMSAQSERDRWRRFQGQYEHLNELGIAPLVIAAVLVTANVLGIAAAVTVSAVATADLKTNEETTKRVQIAIQAAERAAEGLPPKDKLEAVRRATDSLATGGAFAPPPPSESLLDKLKSATVKPVGFALGAAAVYFAVTKLALPALRRKELIP